MKKFRKINDWTILDNEKDGPMIHHARDPESWHGHFVNHINEEYLENSKCRTAVDIGASYGWMSVGFAELFTSVHSYELRTDVVEALRINTNKYDNITVHAFGLGDEYKKVQVPLTSSSGLTSLVHPDATEFIDGQITTLDSLNIPDVDLIKIDVEGFELNVLRGAYETIKKYKPIIIAEVHSNRSKFNFKYRQELFNFLKDLGYELMDVRQADYIFIATGVTYATRNLN